MGIALAIILSAIVVIVAMFAFAAWLDRHERRPA
jgi:hypothetical protein